MTALINFIAPLTPAQTGAFALALAVTVGLFPQILQLLFNIIKAVVELMDTTEDEQYLDWMDAKKYQAEREEMQQHESLHNPLRRVRRKAGQNISAARGYRKGAALSTVQSVQQVGSHKRLQL